MEQPVVGAADRAVLRDLAARVAASAHTPANAERRAAWLALHDGPAPSRPMVLIEDGGIGDRARPFAPALTCEAEAARALERGLRHRLWWAADVADDSVETGTLDLAWRVDLGNYGVEAVQHHADNDGHLGARRWDPPIRDLDGDFARLRPCRPTVDRAATAAHRAWLDDLVGDLLPTRMRGLPFWSIGLTQETIHLIGLEELMLALYDNPDGLHRLLDFQCGQWMERLDWLETERLVEPNNENDYIGSGSRGWRAVPSRTDDGRRPCAVPSPWTLGDCWGLSESQETVGVGPAQFAEFIFPYQKRLADRFGALYYGCCEPVHTRWEVLCGFPNLKAVSVSPWCDEAFMADACARAGVVYSRKPNPTLISIATFDEAAIREDVRRTVGLTAKSGAAVEIIMKDVHTLHESPARLARWVALAREAVAWA